MSRPCYALPCLAAVVLTAVLLCAPIGRGESADLRVDFRYAVSWWQTPICLPDDPEKTLVGKGGELLCQYPVKVDQELLNDYPPPFPGFQASITVGVDDATTWVRQELVSPRVPIVRTIGRCGAVEVIQEAFAVTPVDGVAQCRAVRYRARSPAQRQPEIGGG